MPGNESDGIDSPVSPLVEGREGEESLINIRECRRLPAATCYCPCHFIYAEMLTCDTA